MSGLQFSCAGRGFLSPSFFLGSLLGALFLAEREKVMSQTTPLLTGLVKGSSLQDSLLVRVNECFMQLSSNWVQPGRCYNCAASVTEGMSEITRNQPGYTHLDVNVMA